MCDGTCKSTIPSKGSLAAVEAHREWIELHQHLTARDDTVAPSPSGGASTVCHREASRLISASTPYANGWLVADPDGSRATAVPTDEFRTGLQRRLGLWISSFVPAAAALRARGMAVDNYGDAADGRANHNRQHNAALHCWYTSASAVAEVPVVLGDKENPAATAHFNAGHVVDIAEPGGGAGGSVTASAS